MKSLNNFTPMELVNSLEPKVASFENWTAMSDLYCNTAYVYAEDAVNLPYDRDHGFYQKCADIATEKAKEFQTSKSTVALTFVAGSVSDNVNSNWHAWSSDCKTFASYAEADAYATVCHNEICNQNLVGMTTFCYELRD